VILRRYLQFEKPVYPYGTALIVVSEFDEAQLEAIPPRGA